MAGSESVDQAAKDDAHLRSLGIKPELRRTLGFVVELRPGVQLHRVSTGHVRRTSAVALRRRRPGDLLGVAASSSSARRSSPSYFAELASHFPVAGSIYQWSKRLSNRDARLVHRLDLLLGPGRHGHRGRGDRARSSVDGIHGPIGSSVAVPDRRSGGARPCSSRSSRSRRSSSRRSSTRYGVRLLVDPQQHRRRRPRSWACSCSRSILLFFANHQSPSVLLDTLGDRAPRRRQLLRRRSLLGMFMALFVVYGFDTAGTFGEETIDASRQAPRGVLCVGRLISGSSARSSCSP